MSEKCLGRKEIQAERTGELLDVNFITRHTIGSPFLSVYCTSRRVIKAEGKVTFNSPQSAVFPEKYSLKCLTAIMKFINKNKESSKTYTFIGQMDMTTMSLIADQKDLFIP